jgi:fructose-1,6-bisphosphatase/inositol monophosphatase family enzyme
MMGAKGVMLTPYFSTHVIALGIVNNPMTGHMYTAVKGEGAWLNGDTRLAVSGVRKMCDAMMLMELPAGANDKKKDVAKANIATLLDKAHAIRCPG